MIRKLTPEQALEVLRRLSDKGGAIRDAVLAEAPGIAGSAAASRPPEEDSATAMVSRRC